MRHILLQEYTRTICDYIETLQLYDTVHLLSPLVMGAKYFGNNIRLYVNA